MHIYIYSILIFVELWLFYFSDFVYHYGCHLPSRHRWKPRVCCVYTNCEMHWSQGSHNGAYGIRIHVLFEMLSLLCLFWCFGVAPASNSRETAQPAPLAGLGCVRVTPQPGDQMTLVWPLFSSTQISNFVDSFKWSMAHFYISLLNWSDM